MAKNDYEYSLVIDLARAANDQIKFELNPSRDECNAIAQRVGLVSLSSLAGSAFVNRLPHSNGFEVIGTLNAVFEQSCVVSLVPVMGRLDMQFDFLAMQPKEIEEIDADENHRYFDSDIEPIIEGQIDLGEVFVQIFALSVDPYPKADGVSIEALTAKLNEIESDPNPLSKENPFAVLQRMKDKG